ncbi:hypothetical protein NL676_029594, partial [Syzygium grande]
RPPKPQPTVLYHTMVADHGLGGSAMVSFGDGGVTILARADSTWALVEEVTALSAHSISPSLALGLAASRCLYYGPIHHERIVADWAPLETEEAEKGGLRRTTIMNSSNFSKFERLKELLIK